MKIEAVLIDLDDTLFDFRKSSYEALVQTFGALGLAFGEAQMAHYETFNNAMWEAFERGEIEKSKIYTERFRLYFEAAGIEADPVRFNRDYLHALAEGKNFMPHCEELLAALHGRYRIFVLTNGDTYAQQRRLARSGMLPYFDGVFISEQLNCKKPEKQFYDRVFSIIGERYRSRSIMVGDSLTSDMQGGRNAGIPTCLYGRRGTQDSRCDFVIEDLLELPPLLDALNRAETIQEVPYANML